MKGKDVKTVLKHYVIVKKIPYHSLPLSFSLPFTFCEQTHAIQLKNFDAAKPTMR